MAVYEHKPVSLMYSYISNIEKMRLEEIDSVRLNTFAVSFSFIR